MPGMGGLQCLREIRKNKAHNDLRVLVLSIEADRQCVQQAIELGVSGYLLKHEFSLDRFLYRVKSALENRCSAVAQKVQDGRVDKVPGVRTQAGGPGADTSLSAQNADSTLAQASSLGKADAPRSELRPNVGVSARSADGVAGHTPGGGGDVWRRFGCGPTAGAPGGR